MKIKALVPFSNGTISMEQYEVREVTDTIGNELISAGVAVEIGGGSSGGGVLPVSIVTSGTELFRGTLPDVSGYAWRSSIVGHTENFFVDFACDLSGATYNELSAVVGDVKILPTDVSYNDGIVTIKVGTDSGIKPGYTSEEEISGKTLILYADAELRLDKTWQEIKDAPVAIIEREVTELGQTTYTTFWKIQIGFETGAFYVVFMELTDNETETFVASSASGYPAPNV